MTDYNHQSFADLIADLVEEKNRTIEFRNEIQKNLDTLNSNSYWRENVPFDFRNIISYSITHFNTAISEFEDIVRDIKLEVKEHHVKRLKKIYTVSQEINVNVGKIWHKEYGYKNYGNEDFGLVEQIYCDTRDMAVNLLDTANIAERLHDFIGKTSPNMKRNNPWISGSFYLTVAIIAIAGLAVLSNLVHWSLFPFIIIGGVLLIGIVGVLQLKNDDKITDKSFVSLITETYKRLPLIGQRKIK